MVSKLEGKYQETVKGAGLGSNGAVYELLAGKDTWTIIYTTPDGVSCVVATGVDWLEAIKKPEGEGT